MQIVQVLRQALRRLWGAEDPTTYEMRTYITPPALRPGEYAGDHLNADDPGIKKQERVLRGSRLA